MLPFSLESCYTPPTVLYEHEEFDYETPEIKLKLSSRAEMNEARAGFDLFLDLKIPDKSWVLLEQESDFGVTQTLVRL
jgi:hypothetical protein